MQLLNLGVLGYESELLFRNSMLRQLALIHLDDLRVAGLDFLDLLVQFRDDVVLVLDDVLQFVRDCALGVSVQVGGEQHFGNLAPAKLRYLQFTENFALL